MAESETGTEAMASLVVYTTKELLTRVDAKIDTLTLLLQQKADRSELSGLHDRVATLEAAEHARAGGWTRWKVTAAATAFVLNTGALWAAVIVRHP